VNALAVSRGVVLALETHLLHSLLDSRAVSTWLPFIQPELRTESRLWGLGEAGRAAFATSRIDVTCRSSVLMDDPTTCAAFDGTRTRFFTVDPEAKRLTAVASIAGRFSLRGNGDRDWVDGWWDGTPVVLHATTREAMRLPASRDERPYHLAIGDTVMAAVSWSRDASTVRVYPRP
jgi:hypothetical protein